MKRITLVVLALAALACACASAPENPAKLLVGMLADGAFSQKEQAEFARMAESQNLYAVAVVDWLRADHKSMIQYTMVFGTAKDGLARLGRMINHERGTKARVTRVETWREPDKATIEKARKMAKVALKHIYSALAAARSKFPGLAKFDKDHTRLDDIQVWYCSDAPRRLPKGNPEPTADISVRITTPRLPEHEFEPGSCRYLLRQKLAVVYRAGVKDDKLRRFVRQTVEREMQPLVDAEKALGGNVLCGAP